MRRSLLVFLLAATAWAVSLPSSSTLRAQTANLPRAGRSFNFGIIEGPDNLLGDSAQQQTLLTLTVVSPYEGCGIILSPSGYEQDFSFSPGSPTVITLPYNLMLLHDLGWSNKGIIVKTTEPVNLVLHDYVPSAGDATQIFPDESLDTSYVAFGWGIWDDFLDPEQNNSEILVTAVYDSTQVTIIPSVNTRNGILAGVPFTTMLNHGECYIVKADTSDTPVDPSLSGTQIHSTKPVSVICGLTCAYVPLEKESCNELMDEIIGKKWWGSHFFVAPLGNWDSTIKVVLTSDRDFYALIGKGIVGSTKGRLIATLGGAGEIRTINSQSQPVAVQANQITHGSSQSYFGGITDPTLVTLLDTAYYTDPLIWNTPFFGGFQNWISLIFPTVDYGTILLDGRPLSSVGANASVINNSRYSFIVPILYSGVHTIVSPDPVFGLGTGFALADAYSFMAGGVAGEIPHDTARHTLILQADSATSCSDFAVAASLATPIMDTEGLITLTIPITYDAAALHLVALVPGAMLTNARYSVDSSSTGILTVTIYGQPYIIGSDLFHIVFEGWKQISATSVGKNANVTGCGNDNEAIVIQSVTFSIGPSTDTLQRTLALSNSPAIVCDPVTIPLTADTILTSSDRFVLEKIEIIYDTATQHFLNWTPGPLLVNTLNQASGQKTGDFTILVQNPFPLAGSDTILTLLLEPHTLATLDTVIARVFYLRCADTLERDIMLTYQAGVHYDTSGTLAISTASVSAGDQASADVTISGLPQNTDVKHFDLYLTYNHDVLTYERADLNGTLTGTWPPPTDSRGATTDTLHFTSLAALGASPTPALLAHLIFKTFVADSSYSPISASISLPGIVAGCPVTFEALPASTLFLGKDLCGDTLLREFMLGKRLSLDRAEINSDGNLHLILRAPIAEMVDLSLTDVLGRTVWSREISCLSSGSTEREFALPPGTPSGALTLRVSAGGAVLSARLMIVK
jgi:hypothetical protein